MVERSDALKFIVVMVLIPMFMLWRSIRPKAASDGWRL